MYTMNVVDEITGKTIIDDAPIEIAYSIDLYLFTESVVVTEIRRDLLKRLHSDGIAELVYPTKRGEMRRLTVMADN